METVQQNGRFTLFSSKFPSNIYSILFDYQICLPYIGRGGNYCLDAHNPDHTILISTRGTFDFKVESARSLDFVYSYFLCEPRLAQ